MWSVGLLMLGVHLVYAVPHSLQYFYTGTKGISDFPQFVAVGIVDGQQIDYYDSVIGKNVLKQDWMEGKRDENRITNIRKGHQENFINSVKIVMDRFNQTVGVHTWQMMCGCELDDDGTTRGFWQFGYDGADFVSFDKSTLTWTAANPQAVITKHKWEADRATGEYRKGYLENECIEWVRKYVSYGKNTLERKVAPEVSLLQKDSSAPVVCHATGFYPNNIMMTWKKNQEERFEDVDVSTTLLNEDGTFQKTITLSVTPEEWKKNPDAYRCVVQHAGAAKDIVVILNESNIKTNAASGNIIAIVVGCVVCLAVLAAIIGLIVWKKSNGYGRASTKDSDSENSDQPLPKA